MKSKKGIEIGIEFWLWLAAGLVILFGIYKLSLVILK